MARLFFGVFVVYAFCAYPAFAPRDGADMALAAVTLGVAHPPGYPLYAVLGKAWLSLVPFGDPAYRLNLLSAFCGAWACVAVFALLRRSAGLWPALGAALGLAFSAPLWKFSLLEEKYSLQALFIALLLLLAQGERPSLLRRARLSALLFGLGLVNHQSLVLLAPALVFLWHRELGRHRAAWGLILPSSTLLCLLGLSLYAFVGLRLGDWGLAWRVVTRAEYGTSELFAGFSRPMSWALARNLLAHLTGGLWSGGAGALILLAVPGAWAMRRERRDLLIGLLLALAAFGPLFFLMTRFDLSEWVARSVLEPTFIAPTLLLSVLAGFGLARAGKAAPALAAVVVGCALWSSAPLASHRDDFSAYDYAMSLRRALPPGSAVVVGGDTANFSLKYLDAVGREEPSRLLMSAKESGLREWIERELPRRPVYTLGLSAAHLGELGLIGNLYSLQPAGLVQRVIKERLFEPVDAWPLTVLRRSRAMDGGESYVHDIRLSYAFAHYLSGQMMERSGMDPSAEYEASAVLDPEDYKITWQR